MRWRSIASRAGSAPGRGASWSITLAYIVTFGVLNYAHSGVLTSLAWPACWSRWRCWSVETHRVGTAIAAGIALAGAVGFWAPYILVVPASLAFPLVWFGIEPPPLEGRHE